MAECRYCGCTVPGIGLSYHMADCKKKPVTNSADRAREYSQKAREWACDYAFDGELYWSLPHDKEQYLGMEMIMKAYDAGRASACEEIESKAKVIAYDGSTFFNFREVQNICKGVKGG